MDLKQSTAVNIPFLLISSTDNTSPVTGASPTVTISKNGAAFASPHTGTVTEIGNGWYYLSADSTDTGTLGSLLLHATATGANNCDDIHQVFVDIAGGSVSSVTGAVGSVTGAVGSVTGNVGGNVAGSVGSVAGNVAGSVGSVVATVSANLVGIISTALTEGAAGYLAVAFKKFFNLATPTSTMNEITLVDTITTYTGNTPQTGDSFARLGAPAGASVSADIAEIEAETDGISAIPTNPLLTSDSRLNHLDADISSRLATSGYTAPDNTDIAAIKVQTDKMQFDGSNNIQANTEVATAQIEIKKNAAYNNFMFPMTDASGNPLTGLTVSALISKDGGTPVATSNSVVEVGAGMYEINLVASETNCGTLTLRFTATSAVAQFVTIRTQA